MIATTILRTMRHLTQAQANPKRKLKPEKIAQEGIKILSVVKDFYKLMMAEFPNGLDDKYKVQVYDQNQKKHVPGFNEIHYLRDLSKGVEKVKKSIMEDLKALDKESASGKSLADAISRAINLALSKKKDGLD